MGMTYDKFCGNGKDNMGCRRLVAFQGGAVLSFAGASMRCVVEGERNVVTSAYMAC